MYCLLDEKLSGWVGQESSCELNISGWRPVTSDVPWGSVLESVLFKLSVSDLDEGFECTLRKSVDDAKFGRRVDLLEAGRLYRGVCIG